MSPPTKTVQQYEAEATRLTNGCLIHPSKYSRAHHVYKLRHGNIPKPLQVCHTCDTPRCIEDTHHWLGTQKENMQDASNKNRLIRSPETREKLSSSGIGKRIGNTNAKGHKHTDKWKEEHSKQMKGNSYAKGNKLSDLTRSHMSISKLGNTNASGGKGKPKSEAHKLAISKGRRAFLELQRT